MANPAIPCVVSVASFLPSCAALTSVAGTDLTYYAARLADLTLAYGADGSVTGVSLKTGGKFAKISGNKFQNSGAFDLSTSAIGKSRYKQTWISRAYHRDQPSRNTVRNLSLVQDLVVFAPLNDKIIEVYGATVGLSATAVKGGTGTKLDDDNTTLLTFEGEEPTLPLIFSTVTSPAASTTASAASTASTSLAVTAATGIAVGQIVAGVGIPLGTTVVAISGTTVTLSAPATVASSAALTFSTTDAQDYATNVAVLDALVTN